MDKSDEAPRARQFGTFPNGDWTPESQAYYQDPTVENYLKLRRDNPDAEIQVHTNGDELRLPGIRDELLKYDVDPEIFIRIFEANQETISFYSLFFLEKIEEARKATARGETQLIRRGLAVPDKLVDYFIKCALDAASMSGTLQINRDLIVLIKEQLGGQVSEYERVAETKGLKWLVTFVAARTMAQGKEPSIREIAKLLEYTPSTVWRWFAPGELEASAKEMAQLFTPDGDPKPELYEDRGGES